MEEADWLGVWERLTSGLCLDLNGSEFVRGIKELISVSSLSFVVSVGVVVGEYR